MRTFTSIILFAAFFATASAISCYICNSLYKPDCDTSYEGFLRPCPVKSFGGRKAVKANSCRVVRQYVNEEYSVVRECGYTGEDVVGKSNKGSLGVSRVYTQCSENACNSGSLPLSVTSFFLIAAAAIYRIF